MTRDQKYLNDGVYASHDGFQLWLAVNNHENNVVALDPLTFTSLLGYAPTVFNKVGLIDLYQKEIERLKEMDE